MTYANKIKIETWQGMKWYEPHEAYELLKNDLFAKVMINYTNQFNP